VLAWSLPSLEFCANREYLPVETTSEELSVGRMVIPANIAHTAGALNHRHRNYCKLKDQRRYWQQRRE
jgi:thiamine biosynthesis protein ThiC